MWAVDSTPLQSNIDDLFNTVCTANTLKKLLNAKLSKKDLTPLKLGADYGRALMIQGSEKNGLSYA